MNRKIKGEKILYLLAIIILIATAISCSFSGIWTEYREWETKTRDDKYTINSATLLENIKEGKDGTFSLLTATPPVYPPRSNTPIEWKQSDYLSIAKAFHQFVWNEPFPEGELIQIKFYLNCKEIGYGPQSAKYNLVKITKNKEDETRIDRTIIIDPAYRYADAWEYSYNPNYSRYKFIDLSKINISIESALSVAEKNGGKKLRLKYEDKCTISADLNPNGYYDGWVIEYSLPMSEKKEERFKLLINTMTGEYKEIK